MCTITFSVRQFWQAQGIKPSRGWLKSATLGQLLDMAKLVTPEINRLSTTCRVSHVGVYVMTSNSNTETITLTFDDAFAASDFMLAVVACQKPAKRKLPANLEFGPKVKTRRN